MIQTATSQPKCRSIVDVDTRDGTLPTLPLDYLYLSLTSQLTRFRHSKNWILPREYYMPIYCSLTIHHSYHQAWRSVDLRSQSRLGHMEDECAARCGPNKAFR